VNPNQGASEATLQMLRETIPGLGAGSGAPPTVSKVDATTTGLTMGSGIFGYPLFRPALQLYAVYTYFVEKFGRHQAQGTDAGGDAAHARVVDAIMSGGWDGGIAEGAVGSTGKNKTRPWSADFKSLGAEGEVTFEAISAAGGFDDAKAMETLHTLQRLRHFEEVMDIGGSTTGIIKPASLTLTGLTTTPAGALTAGTTYYYAVSAFTLHGSGALPGNTQATGHAAADASYETDGRTASGAPGGAFASQKLTWPAVPGAVGYNVYVGTTSTVHFLATVNANTYTHTTVPSGTGNVPNTLNLTANALQYDGFLVQAGTWANPAGITLPDGSTFSNFYDMAGAPFTASGYGSVVEIDTMLQRMFQGLLVGFDELVISSREAINLRNKILSATAGGVTSGAPGAFRLVLNDKADGLTGGSVFASYLNPLMPEQPIKVKVHPFFPPGTAVGMTTRLPSYYPNANLPGGTTWAKLTRRDYYGVDYAVARESGRVYPFGNYFEGVLAGFFPGGTVTFSGIGDG
jgi:hypothetical protein